MDEALFRDILEIDSTSGQERRLAQWLAGRLEGFAPDTECMEVGDGTLNLFLKWGSPDIVFCTHLDTVPPYIAPTFTEDKVLGRGSCDAKGQIISILGACSRLAERGCSNFGALFVSGEETGSWGAKAFARTPFRAEYLVVCEPTDNCMVSASKGTKSFDLTFEGEAFHSGYPEGGRSAVEMFVDFCNQLKNTDFPEDPILGTTTYNIGLLHSDNPQNILSPRLQCRIYFRTTFASDSAVCEWMTRKRPYICVNAWGGDAPARYHTVDGIPSKAVAFGSDAPHLDNFEKRMICGPGSIMVAHRDNEHILKNDIEKAITNYLHIYESCNQRIWQDGPYH